MENVEIKLRRAFSGKKILVTGHTGFKGSWLTILLDWLGVSVSGYALAPEYADGIFEAAMVRGILNHHVEANICDQARLESLLSEVQPDAVIHMAAQALVLPSYENPIETYRTNVMGTAILLDSLRRCPSVQAALVVTSDKCYENMEAQTAFSEDAPLGGYDPYSSSKACAEVVTSSFRRSFFGDTGAGIATARAGNVIGGGDRSPYRLLPDLIAALAGEGLPDIRYPKAVRPWQHVLDPLTGYLMLLAGLLEDRERYAGAWNFGPRADQSWTVLEVAKTFEKSWGCEGRLGLDVIEDKREHHEHIHLRLNCSKAHDEIGWAPLLSVASSIQLTTDWEQAVRQPNKDMAAFTKSQIQQYFALESA